MRYLSLIACLFFATSSQAYVYTLTIEGGGTTAPDLVVGDIVNLSLDTPELGVSIWGNMQIEFDPAVLEAVYVDESYTQYGYWTWWIDAPGDTSLCGGGVPYAYVTGGGSDRADQFALEYGEGAAGPSAYLDNLAGKIRFYQSNYLEPGSYEPLRIGFRVLQTGPTTVTIKSQAEPIEFDWCDFDTVTDTDLSLGITVSFAALSFGSVAPPQPDPEALFDQLLEQIENMGLPAPIAKKYALRVRVANRLFSAGRIRATDRQLNWFVRRIQRDLAHERIDAIAAEQLISMATELQSVIA